MCQEQAAENQKQLDKALKKWTDVQNEYEQVAGQQSAQASQKDENQKSQFTQLQQKESLDKVNKELSNHKKTLEAISTQLSSEGKVGKDQSRELKKLVTWLLESQKRTKKRLDETTDNEASAEVNNSYSRLHAEKKKLNPLAANEAALRDQVQQLLRQKAEGKKDLQEKKAREASKEEAEDNLRRLEEDLSRDALLVRGAAEAAQVSD